MVRIDEFPLPRMSFIRSALQLTTERIMGELNTPQAQTPDWSEFEWRVAMAVAVMHGVSALLALRLVACPPTGRPASLLTGLAGAGLPDERAGGPATATDSTAEWMGGRSVEGGKWRVRAAAHTRRKPTRRAREATSGAERRRAGEQESASAVRAEQQAMVAQGGRG